MLPASAILLNLIWHSCTSWSPHLHEQEGIDDKSKTRAFWFCRVMWQNLTDKNWESILSFEHKQVYESINLTVLFSFKATNHLQNYTTLDKKKTMNQRNKEERAIHVHRDTLLKPVKIHHHALHSHNLPKIVNNRKMIKSLK